jgi:hypothetical protein
VIHTGNAGEHARLARERGEVWERHIEMRGRAIEWVHDEQSILRDNRQAIGDHGLVDGEHRRRDADAECEDRDCADREPRGSP